MRLTSAVLLLCCAVVCAACTNPPEKEMNQARGAIAAAGAAGADQYAPDEYKAAVASLKRSEDAAAQRDYRQALNYALDSREQAQNAARTAANQKAAVRSQAERELHDLQVVLDQARDKLKAVEAPRASRRAFEAERRAVESGGASVQEARAAMDRQDYLGARDAMRGIGDELRAAIRQIDQAMQAPSARRRR
jgi:flagellar hook-basal body complex protein FliE